MCIIKGSDVSVTITLSLEGTGLPFDLTNVDEIIVRLCNADSTFLDITLSGGGVTKVSDLGGQLRFDVTDTESALLLAGFNQDFEVELIEFNGQPGEKRTIKQFEGILDVRDRLLK